jgi:hypothetical protein
MTTYEGVKIMRGRWFLRILAGLAFAVVLVFGFSGVVFYLWNWLMPGLFGLHVLGYWQAVGLLILSWVLFGRLPRPGHGGHWRHRMRERWEQMTPEEREKFREGMRHRCGHRGAPMAKPEEAASK